MSGGAIITNSSVMSVGPRRIGALPLDYGQPRGSGVSDAGRRIEPVRTRVPGTHEAAVRAPLSPPMFSFLHRVQPLFPARCLRAVGGRTNFRRIRLWRVPVDGRRTQGKKEDSQSAKQQVSRGAPESPNTVPHHPIAINENRIAHCRSSHSTA